MDAWQKYVRVELYISGEDAERHLAFLEGQKEGIEKQLGYSLTWGDQNPTARDRRVSYYPRNVDPSDETDWQRRHEWLATHLNALHRAFAQRIRNL